MNKDITGDILLRAGFKESVQGFIKIKDNEIITVTEVWRCKPFPNPYREWQVSVFDFRYGQITDTDIQTIDHFNMLMELVDIKFKLKLKEK